MLSNVCIQTMEHGTDSLLLNRIDNEINSLQGTKLS